jgi:hypothetical protein
VDWKIVYSAALIRAPISSILGRCFGGLKIVSIADPEDLVLKFA